MQNKNCSSCSFPPLFSWSADTDPSGSKIQVQFNAGDGSQMPVQISVRPLAKNGSNRATIGMVVTDLTDARRTEELPGS